MTYLISIEELCTLAKEGKLPLDFTDWDLKNEHGQTIAEIAMEHGVIPSDYDPIYLYNNRYTFAHVLARIGKLPVLANNSPVWRYTDVLGWTVIHEAATYHPLPEDYDDWTFTDGDRRETVAKTAARHGNLPKSFNDWPLPDEDGNTVAHEAAAHGTLPPNFNLWGLLNSEEESVGFVAARCGTLPEGFQEYHLENAQGRTIAHEAARCGNLPKDFKLYGLADHSGWTVAHECAHHGYPLPDDFEDLDMEDDSGTTVADVVKRRARFGGPNR